MQLTWKQRLENEPYLNSFETWPQIDTNLLPRSKRKAFLRNKRIIAKVLSGSTLKDVAEEFGLSSSRISHLLTRCLAGEELSPPPLTKALIPDLRINTGSRKKPLSEISNPCGCRGAFGYLLETVPNLKELLDGLIFSGLKRERHAQNITPKYFHKEFLRLLRDANWPETTYPFDQQHLGYESCRQYLNVRINEFKIPKPRKIREVLTTKTTTIPYQEIQIDAQIQDVSTSVQIDVNGHTSDLRLSRVTLFLATDVATGCHLAYQLCLTKDPSQMDLLSLLEMIHTPWEPMKLMTPGLSYQPGACLPSALGELNQNVSVGMVRMDNALCHMSHMVRKYVCEDMGATLNFGLPAQPKSRNMVEYAFKRLNEYTHRFASTTGSNSHDSLREAKKNINKPPLITINTLNEILSVLITHHNVTPQERFGGLSPLDVMKSCMENLLVPMSFAHLEKRDNPFLRQKKALVRCITRDNRRPHVNFEGFRYSGTGLLNSGLVNREIIIEYDIRDLRSINAYSNAGEELGPLYAPKSWQSFPHSLYTRRIIRKVTRKKLILGTDPLSGYFSYLLENKELPKQATELLRVYKEFTRSISSLGTSHSMTGNELAVTQPDTRTKTSIPNCIPAWSIKLMGDGK